MKVAQFVVFAGVLLALANAKCPAAEKENCIKDVIRPPSGRRLKMSPHQHTGAVSSAAGGASGYHGDAYTIGVAGGSTHGGYNPASDSSTSGKAYSRYPVSGAENSGKATAYSNYADNTNAYSASLTGARLYSGPAAVSAGAGGAVTIGGYPGTGGDSYSEGQSHSASRVRPGRAETVSSGSGYGQTRQGAVGATGVAKGIAQSAPYGPTAAGHGSGFGVGIGHNVAAAGYGDTKLVATGYGAKGKSTGAGIAQASEGFVIGGAISDIGASGPGGSTAVAGGIGAGLAGGTGVVAGGSSESTVEAGPYGAGGENTSVGFANAKKGAALSTSGSYSGSTDGYNSGVAVAQGASYGVGDDVETSSKSKARTSKHGSTISSKNHASTGG